MAVLDQLITDRYALYNGDCCEVLPSLPGECIDFSIYSPPFGTKKGGLYQYSSSDRDLSNSLDYKRFLEHYEFVVEQMGRLTKPGRMTCVHAMDTPEGDGIHDFSGDIIRLHEKHGFEYHDRKLIWKDPLKEAYRMRALALRHNQLLKCSTPCRSALPDYLLVMRKKGTNKVPVGHPQGLLDYAGELDAAKRTRVGYLPMPDDLLRIGREWKGHPNDNPLSHWIFRRYASPVWEDIRSYRVLPYRKARESEEEKHVHPLQRDIVERGTVLYSNPGERVLTPFAGVGSEVVDPVRMGRFGVAVELKSSYYRQMARNVESIGTDEEQATLDLGADEVSEAEAWEAMLA